MQEHPLLGTKEDLAQKSAGELLSLSEKFKNLPGEMDKNNSFHQHYRPSGHAQLPPTACHLCASSCGCMLFWFHMDQTHMHPGCLAAVAGFSLSLINHMDHVSCSIPRALYGKVDPVQVL